MWLVLHKAVRIDGWGCSRRFEVTGRGGAPMLERRDQGTDRGGILCARRGRIGCGAPPWALAAASVGWRCATRAGLLKLPADVEMPAGCGMSTMRRARSSSSGHVCGALGGPGPRHELVETRSRPEIDQPGENIGQISLRVDATEFAGLDERGDAGPILRTLIMPGEERILAIENNRADASFDDVGVELDAAVVEEPREAVPMVQGVADVLGDGGLGRDASELLLEPGLECRHERLAALLAHRAALIGTAAPDRLLD